MVNKPLNTKYTKHDHTQLHPGTCDSLVVLQYNETISACSCRLFFVNFNQTIVTRSPWWSLYVCPNKVLCSDPAGSNSKWSGYQLSKGQEVANRHSLISMLFGQHFFRLVYSPNISGFMSDSLFCYKVQAVRYGATPNSDEAIGTNEPVGQQINCSSKLLNCTKTDGALQKQCIFLHTWK